MDYPVSEELRAMLNRQEMRGTTAPTVRPHPMKWANELLDLGGDEDHSPSGGEELRPNRLPRVRIIRSRPFLAVIDCGR